MKFQSQNEMHFQMVKIYPFKFVCSIFTRYVDPCVPRTGHFCLLLLLAYCACGGLAAMWSLLLKVFLCSPSKSAPTACMTSFIQSLYGHYDSFYDTLYFKYPMKKYV